MDQEPIALRKVRFRVYHGGMGADIGTEMHVAADWAERAIKSGIVEAVPEEDPKAEAKPAN